MVNIDHCHIIIHISFPITFYILLENTTAIRTYHILDIYDNEEMAPDINIENEELKDDENEASYDKKEASDNENEASDDENKASEDDIEIKSKYERMMIDLNESDEMKIINKKQTKMTQMKK